VLRVVPAHEAQVGVRDEAEVLQEGHPDEEQRRERRHDVAHAPRQEDRGDDDVEHVEERERILDAARDVEREREDGEVHHDLPPGERHGRDPPAREAREDDVQSRQEPGQAAEVAPGDLQVERRDDARGQQDPRDRQPAQPDEPADAFRELGRRGHEPNSNTKAGRHKGEMKKGRRPAGRRPVERFGGAI
jgi:hypothetical protein